MRHGIEEVVSYVELRKACRVWWCAERQLRAASKRAKDAAAASRLRELAMMARRLRQAWREDSVGLE